MKATNEVKPLLASSAPSFLPRVRVSKAVCDTRYPLRRAIAEIPSCRSEQVDGVRHSQCDSHAAPHFARGLRAIAAEKREIIYMIS